MYLFINHMTNDFFNYLIANNFNLKKELESTQSNI